jgi:hypothetical protein
VELYFHSPNAPSWGGAQLRGAQGQFYLLFSDYQFLKEDSAPWSQLKYTFAYGHCRWTDLIRSQICFHLEKRLKWKIFDQV